MQGLGALLILATWVGSAIFGWTHHLWWLVVPPIVMLGFLALLTGTTSSEMARHGIGVGETIKNIGASAPLGFALWNTLLASAVFGIAWLLSGLL
jgi:hypothetical protein